MLFLILTSVALFLTILNAFTMRSVKVTDSVLTSESVAILIPMRNESSNVIATTTSALEQTSIPGLAVTVLNDGSSDNTEDLLKSIHSPNFRYVNGRTLPEGWLGKVFACHQLSADETAEFLVFLDADVRLQPTAVSAAIATMKRLNWDFISPYPQEIAITFAERLIQPLLQWSWLASVPLRLAEKFPNRSMTIANGQFFIVRRSAYEVVGGHEAIKNEILDDLELARSLIAAKFKGGVADGSAVAQCRMYGSAPDLIDGYTKSLWRAFGGIPGSVLTVLLFLATGVIPFLIAINGSLLGWYAYFAIVLSRIVAAAKTKGAVNAALLHPLSALFFIYLVCLSWVRKSRGALKWRDRSVAN